VSTVHRPPSTVHCPLPFAHCPPPPPAHYALLTPHCPLPAALTAHLHLRFQANHRQHDNRPFCSLLPAVSLDDCFPCHLISSLLPSRRSRAYGVPDLSSSSLPDLCIILHPPLLGPRRPSTPPTLLTCSIYFVQSLCKAEQHTAGRSGAPT
jgi:hypothetical protein